MKTKFKDFLNEGVTSEATNMENAIISVWNGEGDSFPWTEKLTQENVNNIVEQLKKKGLKGKGEQIGAGTVSVTKEWTQFFEGGKVPGGTRTPKTDIVIGKDKISLKTGTAAQLMSGGKSESQATFYAAITNMKSKDKMINDLGKKLDQLVTSNVAASNLRTAIKSGKDELVNKANEIHKEIQSEITSLFASNAEFGYWFTREAMYGEVKFGGNIGTASDMLATTFDGSKVSYHPITDSAYIKDIAKRVKPSVRFKTGSVKKRVDGKTVKTGEYRYWSVIGLNLTKIAEELEGLDGDMLTEGKISDIVSKVKGFFKKLFAKIKKWLKESVANIFKFLDIEPMVRFDNSVNFL